MDITQPIISLITGASSGIGLEIARQLSRQGSHVWLLARDRDRLASALESVEALRCRPDQRFGMISADVSDPSQAEAAVRTVSEEIGTPHLLVNAAGVTHPGYFQELDLELFRWNMDINYFGTVYMCKALIPGMIERKSGHIVNFSSVTGFFGVFGYTAYAASKFAVAGFSDSLRAEMKPHGIRLSVVFPPDVDTPQLAYEKPFKPRETRALAALSTVMKPEAVAAAVLRGVARNKYIILPGFDSKLIYWVTRLSGTAAYPIMDFVMRLAGIIDSRKNTS